MRQPGVDLALIIGLLCGNVIASESDIDSAQVQPSPEDSVASPSKSELIIFSPEESLQEFLDVSDTTNTEGLRTQQPTTALFKSLAIPGWGQLGNRSYKKAVFFGGLELVLIGAALNYRGQASDAWDEFSNTSDTTTAGINRLYDYYDDRKTKRNRYTWFAALTIFISMFDAYTDAHLSGFPTKRDDHAIEVEIGPTPDYSVGASLKLRF